MFFWTSYAVMYLNAALYVAAIASTWMTCSPMQKEYRPWVDGFCIERKKMDETVTMCNLVFDLVILLLPQPVIWRLKTGRKQKLGIALVFSVGLIACACTTGRVYSTFKLDYHHDATYYAPVTELWGLAEGTCILLVFCIPTVPKIFKTDDHVIAKIVQSLLSPAKLSQASQSRRPAGQSWPGRKSSREAFEGDFYLDAHGFNVPVAGFDHYELDPHSDLDGLSNTLEASKRDFQNPGALQAMAANHHHP
ncbi:hypothetical protein E8E14_010769 [Neopestalotiopsis sp. 37M]|nr:hypothetical protein E8E14_010769 [Neopestalotiopsis sp. 37M]